MALPSSNIPNGQLQPASTWGDFNNMAFVIQQAMAKMQTATLVRVESCTNAGTLTAVGFVDITPLVNQIDGQNSSVPHTTIYNVPYLRIQGGANAVILDPQVGDIGLAVFASRDISNVKSSKKQSPPASHRQYSFSDAIYLGGLLNGVPSQYVQFNADGITIHSPMSITFTAPDIHLSAQTIEIIASTSATLTTPLLTINGSVSVTGNVTASGTSLHTHVHGGVSPGGSNTGVPI